MQRTFSKGTKKILKTAKFPAVFQQKKTDVGLLEKILYRIKKNLVQDFEKLSG